MSVTIFNPALNPYVSRMEEHSDIIKTAPIEENQELMEFIRSSQSLIMDLGCGAGNFLRDYASHLPDASFLGFELRFKRLVKGALKLKKRNLSNVRLIRARAEDIDVWVPKDSVEEIHVNFPDPWPKKKQLKHRLMKKEFFMKAHEILVEGGYLVFKTDHREYFESVTELLTDVHCFQIVEQSDDLHQSEFNETNILTEFEALFKGKGFPVYYLKIKAQ